MITIRRNTERQHSHHGKQDIWFTFNPHNYPDQLLDGFGSLAGLNEIRFPPGGGSGPHRCAETEIVTYVYKGALAHEDSTGSSGVISTGEFLRMTIGRIIYHKDMNTSPNDWTHIFRIYLRPSVVGLDCTDEQKRFTAAERRNVLCIVASPDGRKGSLRIHQDALIYSSILDPGHHLVHELLPGRSAWLHIVYGETKLNDIVLTHGDGVGITNEPSVSLTVQENSEILLIDLGPAPKPFGSAGDL